MAHSVSYWNEIMTVVGNRTHVPVVTIVDEGTMLGFLKKRIHEPVKQQHADLDHYPDMFARQILGGEDCDEISGGQGEFGSRTNPIPVNGSLGEIKYLAKLRGKAGNALFFHRIGSVHSPATEHSVDLYVVVCLDGTQWNKLYFDMYHPRRSNRAPEGYTLMPFNKRLGMDLPMGYGVNELVDDFPYGLPDMLTSVYGSQAMARHSREWLSKYDFTRPFKS